MFEATTALEAKQGESSLGGRFAQVRESKGILIEQAARETRIRAQRLREIESDDFSHFSHPSYARLFLVDYAKYLGVPLTEIAEHLPPQGAVGCEGYQYLQESPERQDAMPLPSAARRLRKMMLVAVGLVVGGFLVVELTITLRKIERITRVAQDDRALLSQVEAPARDGAPAVMEQAMEEAVDDESAAEPQAQATPAATEKAEEAVPSPLFVGGVLDHASAIQ